MNSYLLDSTIIIDLINNRRNRRKLVEEIAASGGMLACSVVSVAEIYAGIRPKEEAITNQILRSLVQYEVSASIAGRAGYLKNAAAKQGITILLPDALIAATVIENGLTLVTDNVKHFPMQEIKLYPLPQN
jgi:predicted nucleic acid-binding protein